MIITPMHEFNPNHEPAGSSKGGQFAHTTIVGITSQRPVGDPGHQSNREVYQTMRAFEQELRQIRTVTDAKVQPGLGAWEGGNEASWVVSYRGNGEATRLLARYGRDFNQDAVLMLKGCKVDCQPAVELEFDRPVSSQARDAVHAILGGYRKGDGSLVMGGWTWFKRNGKTVLRMVSVPQWGGDAAQHTQIAGQVSRDLMEAGLTHRSVTKPVTVEIMERAGDHGYDQFLGGAHAA